MHMQFTNNSKQHQDDSSRRKILLVIAITFALIILPLIMYLSTSKDDTPNTEGSGQYHDPVSGETVSDPEGKAPETYGTDSPPIDFLGFHRLMDRGATMYHADAVKKAFEDYSKNRDEKIKEISLYEETIKLQPFERGAEVRVLKFSVLINRKDRSDVELEYSNLTKAKVRIFQDGKIVHSSDLIDPSVTDYTGDGVPPEER